MSKILRLRFIVNKSTMATMNNRGKKTLKRIAKKIEIMMRAPDRSEQQRHQWPREHRKKEESEQLIKAARIVPVRPVAIEKDLSVVI